MLIKRLSMAGAMLVAIVAMVASAAPAGAGTYGSAAASPRPFITCSRSPGHYCAKVDYRSEKGGVNVTETLSTGYTRGRGEGREFFRYSCKAGTCFVLPSKVLHYSSADVQLNVTRKFSGSGLFLPCGAEAGVQYRDPAVNSPGPGAVLFRVRCSGAAHTIARS